MSLNLPVQTLDGAMAAFREGEVRLLTDVADALADFGEAAAEDRQRLLEVAQDLREMFFLVVVIGEFNAGKSSFVNALLGEEILPMGITPTTELIELIRYGEVTNRTPRLRDDGIREWVHFNSIASGVALVDTPGTGSVFQRHERTAKTFLHRSDLVIFVISAKRAFAETERLYLELAKNYGKKIIIVINQIDLLSPSERAEVRRFVERQAEELLSTRPLIFMTSAKEALAALRSGQVSENDDPGGVKALRAHLRGVFSEAPPARQKLLSQLETLTQIVHRYDQFVKNKSDLVSADSIRLREIQHEMERQSVGLSGQLAEARAQIDTAFEDMRLRGLKFISDNLSITKIGRFKSREALQREFQDVTIGKPLREIETATNDYINAVIDNSRLYWRGIIDRLNQLQDVLEQEVAGFDANIYAEQRQALQEAIKIAEAELKTYSSGQVVGDLQTVFQSNLNSFAASIGATIGGFVLVLLASVPGGIAALELLAFGIGAPLAVGGAVGTVIYFRRVSAKTQTELNVKIDALRKTYREALDAVTEKERSRLNGYGKQVLTPIFSRLEVLANKYIAQQTILRSLMQQVETLRRGIEAQG